MRRALGFTGAWVTTTIVAMGVSWLGCAIVLNAGTKPTPSVVADLQAVDAAKQPQPTATQSFPPPQSAGTGRALPPKTAPPRTTPPRSDRSSRPPAQPITLPGTVPVVLVHARPPRPQAPPAPTIQTTPPGGPQPQPALQEIDTSGGRAWIGFSSDGVALLSLHPNDGFDWYLVQDTPGALLVVLTRQGQEFDVYAAWNGAPTASITEYRW
jgi:hypothetical protein